MDDLLEVLATGTHPQSVYLTLFGGVLLIEWQITDSRGVAGFSVLVVVRKIAHRTIRWSWSDQAATPLGVVVGACVVLVVAQGLRLPQPSILPLEAGDLLKEQTEQGVVVFWQGGNGGDFRNLVPVCE